MDNFFSSFVGGASDDACSVRYYRNFSEKISVSRVVSAYKSFELDAKDTNLAWDHVRHDQSMPMNAIVDQRMWTNLVGQGGMACSLTSLANFMIALYTNNIPHVSPDEFVYAQNEMLRGHAGGTGANAIIDPTRNLIAVGTSSSELQNAFRVEAILQEDPQKLLTCLR